MIFYGLATWQCQSVEEFFLSREEAEACLRQVLADEPGWEPSRWAAVENPEERLQIALCEIYAYFRTTKEMTANVRRDLPELPVLQEVATPVAQYWEAARIVLDRGWKTRGHRRALVRAVIGHAVEFETWRSLACNQGLEDVEAAEIMVRLARAVQT